MAWQRYLPIAVVALGIAAFLLLFERHTEVVTSGLSAAARDNTVLAAQRFLTELDVTVRSQDGFALPDDLGRDVTVVVPFVPAELPSAFAKPLLEWVATGGTLILVARDENDPTPDPVLDRFGVRTRSRTALSNDVVRQTDTPTELTVPTADRPLRIQLSPWVSLVSEAAPDWATPAEEDAWFMSFTFGEGRVWALANAFFLTNWSIDAADNAELTWHLTTTGGVNREVLFILNEQEIYPSLAELLWRDGGPLIVSLGILLVLIVWRSATRIGPPAVIVTDQRRSLRDHVEATGRLLWRHRRGTTLIESLRRELVRATVARYPALGDLPTDQQRHAVARTLALSEQDSAVLTAVTDRHDEQAFVHSIATLLRLRSRL